MDEKVATHFMKSEDHKRIKKLKKTAGTMHGVVTKALDAYELVLELKKQPENQQIVMRLIAL